MNLNEKIQITTKKFLHEFEGSSEQIASIEKIGTALLKYLPEDSEKNVYVIPPIHDIEEPEEMFIRLQPKDLNNLPTILKIIDDNGWFAGSYISEETHEQKICTENHKEIFYSLKNKDTIRIVLEKYYDNDVKTPAYLWHVTPIEFLQGIKKNGLVPEYHSKMAWHPKRIYVAGSQRSAENIYSQLKKYEDPSLSGTYALLKIDKKGLKNKFYDDPDFNDGAYTVDPIPPSKIKVVKKLK